MTHPYAEWLRAIADGGHLEYQYVCDGTWHRLELDDDKAAHILRGRTPLIGIYRIAPKTRRIGEFDVPYGLSEADEIPLGTTVWVADPVRGAHVGIFGKTPPDALTLPLRGLLHRTREAAELHVKALRSL